MARRSSRKGPADEKPAAEDDPPNKEDTTEEAKADEPLAEAQKKEIPPLPPGPVDRDVCVGDENHKGTVLLMDLIRLYYVIVKKEKGDDGAKMPTTEKDVEELASHLTTLMMEGKKLELSGLKDVPKPFLVGEGRFFEKSGDDWSKMSKEQAHKFVAKTILAQFSQIAGEEKPFSSDVDECVETLFKGSDPSAKDPDEPSNFSAPRPCDVLFLPIGFDWQENMPYEHQSGNKHLLFLASQHVAADTNDSIKRVEAAFKLVTSKIEVNSGTELVPKTPRYVAQEVKDTQNSWRELTKEELAEVSIRWLARERSGYKHTRKFFMILTTFCLSTSIRLKFACIFTFEVFVEKQIHGMGVPLSSQVANLMSETAKPSTLPVDSPTPHDVLVSFPFVKTCNCLPTNNPHAPPSRLQFGRGGMTNGHQGNRRFRDSKYRMGLSITGKVMCAR